jgi:S1-C subfamily serine protease
MHGDAPMIERIGVAAALLLAFTLASCTRNADDAFVASVQRLRPSVVLLRMKVPPENKHDRYDEAYATGFVVASGRWGSDVLTVQHAIDGAWDLSVTVGNRARVPAKVVASNDDLDVALVRIAKQNLTVVPLGSSAHLQQEIGREVGLLGYPVPDEFGDEGLGLATSLNTGRLSSIRKDAIEVTLSIVPGESGGPVFIADTGEVIGIAESRFDEERSIGFALPIDAAKKFLHATDAAHGL